MKVKYAEPQIHLPLNKSMSNLFFLSCLHSRFQFFWVTEDGETIPKCPISLQSRNAPRCSTFNAGATLSESMHFDCRCVRCLLDVCICVKMKMKHKIGLYVFPAQVKLWYDKVGHQLIVNVLQAIDLSLRPDGRPRSPYVKVYFLPDRR